LSASGRQAESFYILNADLRNRRLGHGEFYANWAYGLNLQQVSPVSAIAQASTPILLIHGLADVRTPQSKSEELARANPRNSLWLVPNALHTGAYSAAPDEFHRRVLGWFARHTSV